MNAALLTEIKVEPSFHGEEQTLEDSPLESPNSGIKHEPLDIEPEDDLSAAESEMLPPSTTGKLFIDLLLQFISLQS